MPEPPATGSTHRIRAADTATRPAPIAAKTAVAAKPDEMYEGVGLRTFESGSVWLV